MSLSQSKNSFKMSSHDVSAAFQLHVARKVDLIAFIVATMYMELIRQFSKP